MSARTVHRITYVTALAMLLGTGCDFAVRMHGAPPHTAEAAPPKKAAPSGPLVAADPLGERPTLAKPSPFAPKPPVEFEVAGVKVWLSERSDLPIVSAAFVVPTGSSSDPADKPGLAQLTADMMDEGAGKRDSVELSTAVADLGATLAVGANLDATFASVSSLKGHFGDVFAILCDVVARPKLAPKDFTRVTGLWKNALKKRGDDPSSVAMLVSASARYGQKSPYGHPALGLLSKADSLRLDDVKKAWQGAWRPGRVTLVITGQITRAEVEDALKKNLGDWKASGEATPTPVMEQGPKPPRLVFVDRPKAVQSVIVVSRDGVRAGSDEAAPLGLVNTALGGSFTSRLNLNLREDKGWTYGAGSSFTETRGTGLFLVRTSVETPNTGPAVREILKELDLMSQKGLSAEETEKVKAQDRADLVSTFETTSGTNSELSSLAGLGLPPGYDLSAANRRQAATVETLASLAKSHVGPLEATIVVVGDEAVIKPQLADMGLLNGESWTVEGAPVEKAGAAAPPTPKPNVSPQPKGNGAKASEKSPKDKAGAHAGHRKDGKKKKAE